VGAELLDVARAIVLLVGPRLLVLLDRVGLVLGDGGAADDADLAVIAHLLRVEVEVRLDVLQERALRDERHQVLRALR
jgi:hypothetical protein